MELSGGRTLKLAFLMRLRLSVCVFHVLSALLLAGGCREGGEKGGKLGVSDRPLAYR